MLCGLSVPSSRSLWGAVRNRQLYILRMYCSCISFNFSFFFSNLHDLPQKKIARIYRKKKLQLFFLSFTRLTAKKKLHDLTMFLYTSYIFHDWKWPRMTESDVKLAEVLKITGSDARTIHCVGAVTCL